MTLDGFAASWFLHIWCIFKRVARVDRCPGSDVKAKRRSVSDFFTICKKRPIRSGNINLCASQFQRETIKLFDVTFSIWLRSGVNRSIYPARWFVAKCVASRDTIIWIAQCLKRHSRSGSKNQLFAFLALPDPSLSELFEGWNLIKGTPWSLPEKNINRCGCSSGSFCFQHSFAMKYIRWFTLSVEVQFFVILRRFQGEAASRRQGKVSDVAFHVTGSLDIKTWHVGLLALRMLRFVIDSMLNRHAHPKNIISAVVGVQHADL